MFFSACLHVGYDNESDTYKIMSIDSNSNSEPISDGLDTDSVADTSSEDSNPEPNDTEWDPSQDELVSTENDMEELKI